MRGRTVATAILIAGVFFSCNKEEDSLTETNSVNANFAISKSEGSSPLTVECVNTSENATSYEWISEGGVISTDENLKHTFTSNSEEGESFKIKLIAYGEDSREDSMSKSVTVYKPEMIDTNKVFNESKTYGTVEDMDGNIYKTIVIGDKVWMAENLRTTRYNDGSEISVFTDTISWSTSIKGGYASLNHSAHPDTINTMGYYYNWYAVESAKLAPEGWRVPTYADWEELIGNGDTGWKKLMEEGSTHWFADFPDMIDLAEGTNSSGLTVLPAGAFITTFHAYGREAFFWTSERGVSLNYGKFVHLYWGYVGISGYPATFGMSVRCVKDVN